MAKAVTVKFKQDFEKRVKEKMDFFGDDLDRFSGSQKKLIEDALHDYCRVCVLLDDVSNRVISEGTTVEDMHGKPKKNPDVTTMHQLSSEKVNLLSKLIKFMKDSDDESDELDKFLS